MAQTASQATVYAKGLKCRKSATWDRRLYFPSEGRHAEDFFAPKNPTASAGFELANLGTRVGGVTRRYAHRTRLNEMRCYKAYCRHSKYTFTVKDTFF
jgi:hypothetical protein